MNHYMLSLGACTPAQTDGAFLKVTDQHWVFEDEVMLTRSWNRITSMC